MVSELILGGIRLPLAVARKAEKEYFSRMPHSTIRRMANKKELTVNMISTSLDGPFPGIRSVRTMNMIRAMKLPFVAYMYLVCPY